MLSRYAQDCRFYLGNGRRDAKYALYYQNEESHIKAMIKTYGELKIKPLWLSMQEILAFATEMDIKVKYSRFLTIKDKLLRTYQSFKYFKK